jgi:predicted nucleic acid-binding protein
MASIGLAEFARDKKISLRRAQQLAARGQINASKIGNMWLVDSNVLINSLRSRRPLSPRSGAALADALDNHPLPELDPQELSRLRKRVDALAGPDSPELIRDWLSKRQVEVRDLAANARDLDQLLNDERVARGGISDARSRLSSAGEAELYVSKRDADSVARKWMLVSSDRPNVRMHVVAELPDGNIPLAWILADLGERGGPRESQQVRELLRGVLA